MSSYRVVITPTAWREVKDLPGQIRQRIRRAIDDLATKPRPHGGKPLVGLEEIEIELWRLRLDKWRVVYAITETERIVDVLAVRRRPPYDYGDLGQLLLDIAE